MSSETLAISDIDAVCEIASRHNIQKISYRGLDIEFFENTKAGSGDPENPQKKRPDVSEDDLLINPMAGFDNA